MTALTEAPAPSLAGYTGRPRYEGANIRTWIGFKHFMYLVEDAVLQHFRDLGHGPERLYLEHGLGLSVTDSSGRLPATLGIDDQVAVQLRPLPAGTAPGAEFKVRLTVRRDGADVPAYTGKVRVALVTEADAPHRAPAPVGLAGLVVPELAATAPGTALPVGSDPLAKAALPGSNSFVWSWRIPYFYCQYSQRMQHSGYVRALEEVVDRFLADRGISVGRMLTERGWIPVVSQARVTVLADALMEETLHTVFTVEEVLKDVLHLATMDCYVERDGRFVHTATAAITHGYAVSRGPDAGSLAVFDDETRTALLGEEGR